MPTRAYPNAIVSYPSSYGTRPDASKSGQGPSQTQLSFMFPIGVDQTFAVSMQNTFPFGLSNIQTVFVDNSANGSPVTISFPSGEVISAAPFTRGWYPATTNTLTFEVNSQSTNGATVLITCFNYIVPPMIANSTGLVLGSRDEIVPLRAATQHGFIQQSVVAPGGGVAFQAFSGTPFYYVTAYDVTMIEGLTTDTGEWLCQIYDSLDHGVTADRIFWVGYVTSEGARCNRLISANSGLSWVGGSQLYFSWTGAIAAPGVVFSANVWGGVTSVFS